MQALLQTRPEQVLALAESLVTATSVALPEFQSQRTSGPCPELDATLLCVMAAIDSPGIVRGSEGWEELLERFFWQIALPIMSAGLPTGESGESGLLDPHAGKRVWRVTAVAAASQAILPEDRRTRALDAVLQALRAASESELHGLHANSEHAVPPLVALDFVQRFLRASSSATEAHRDEEGEIFFGAEWANFSEVLEAVLPLLEITDSEMRTTAGSIVGSLFALAAGRRNRAALSRWTPMLWCRVRTIAGLVPKHAARKDLVTLLAKVSTPLLPTCGPAGSQFDVCTDETFWICLQEALKSGDAARRKLSLYALKKVLDSVRGRYAKSASPATAVAEGEASSGPAWTPYFQWDPRWEEKLDELWGSFFFLYDIMHESSVHLVEPALPSLSNFIKHCSRGGNEPHLDPSWWTILLTRGLDNDMTSVRRRVADFMVFCVRDDPSLARRLVGEVDFMLGPMLEFVSSNLSFFAVAGVGTFVSQFGEGVTRLFELMIASADSSGQMQAFVHRTLRVVLSNEAVHPVVALYVMQALERVPPAKETAGRTLGDEDLAVFDELDRHRFTSNLRVRNLICRFGLAAVANFCDPKVVKFESLLRSVTLLAERAQPRYVERVRALLTENFMLAENIRDAVRAHLAAVHEPRSDWKRKARRLALFAGFLRGDARALETAFREVADMLATVYTRPYAPPTVKVKLAILAGELLAECGERHAELQILREVIGVESWLTRALVYVKNELVECDDFSFAVDLVDAMTRCLAVPAADRQACRNEEEFLRLLYNDSIATLRIAGNGECERILGTELSKVKAFLLVNVVFGAMKARNVPPDWQPLQQDIAGILRQTIRRPVGPSSSGSAEWQKLFMAFEPAKWNAVSAVVEWVCATGVAPLFDPGYVLDRLSAALENATCDDSTAMFRCLGRLVAARHVWNAEKMAVCLEFGLDLVLANKSISQWFAPLSVAFTDFAFCPAVLRSAALSDLSRKVFGALADLGEVKPHVFTRVSTRLYEFWRQSDSDPCAFEHMRSWQAEFVRQLLWGPMRDSDAFKQQAALAMKAEAEERADCVALERDTAAVVFSQSDYLVRVQVQSVVIHWDPENPAHIDLAEDLFARLMDTAQTRVKHVVYQNQLEYRIKLRCWVALLMLTPFLTAAAAGTHIGPLFRQLELEKNMDIRAYIGWTLLRVIIKFPVHVKEFWSEVNSRIGDFKPHLIVSLLKMSFILGESLAGEAQLEFYREAARGITPWLASNHFNVRVYAQISFLRCYAFVDGTPAEEAWRPLRAMRDFLKTHSDTEKTMAKLRKNYLVDRFDPVKDFNVNAVFREVMSVIGAAENERIAERAFEKVDPRPSKFIPFRNPARMVGPSAGEQDSPLAVAAVQPVAESLGPSNRCDPRGDVSSGGGADFVQKKIEPWELLAEADLNLVEGPTIREKKDCNPLILVASLIDKAPNIGGLTRTCEVFNASELVIRSLKMKEDDQFKALSMNAEHWIRLTEVPEKDLETYLMSKKDENYTIIGLEQTTNSMRLSDYRFPSKSVLLLGRERDGIPPHLLQLVDQTLEIPQYGVTRSLNVHVSGALAVYEYTKQAYREVKGR